MMPALRHLAASGWLVLAVGAVAEVTHLSFWECMWRLAVAAGGLATLRSGFAVAGKEVRW